jgi:predicted RNA-binding protein with PUA-like domain
MLVDVKLTKKTRLLSLEEMRGTKGLETMVVLQRGNRLSITPVTPAQWSFIVDTLIGPKTAR